MNKNCAVYFLLLALSAFVSVALATNQAIADEAYTFVVKKQEEKAKSHWSLSEWLDTRDRMRLQDMWLALHSPSPYEFFVGTDYRWLQPSGGSKYSNWEFQFAAYASIFGLEVSRSLAPSSEWLGIFDLRVFGYHAQGTNITFQGGVRSAGDPVSFRSAIAGVASTIYIAQFFGIDGYWRHYFQSVPNATGLQSSGNQWELNGFIDFSFLRVYGGYVNKSMNTGPALGTAQDVSATGFKLGTRLFL